MELESRRYKQSVREAHFCLKKINLKGELIASYNYLMGVNREGKTRFLLSKIHGNSTKGNRLRLP